jgi:DNA polymerase-3 subunit epsilon
LVLAENETGVERASIELIVKPEGYTIPTQASNIHGITTELATAVGVPLMTALSVFCKLREIADEIVAYNLPFDELVMAAAIARSGRKPSHPGPAKRTCAMQLATPIVNLPPTAKMIAAGFVDKPKPPNLTEAHKFFFDGRGFEGAHGALTDTRACMRVYNAIIARTSIYDAVEQGV